MRGVSSQRVYGSTASSLTNPAAWLTHPTGQDLEQRDGADPRVRTFESKQSCVSSLVHLGFLCLGRPKLDATVHVVCCYVRNLQPGIDHTK
jgi:hypothetical protein